MKTHTETLAEIARIKEQHPGTIVIVRHPDFYAVYGEDAQTFDNVVWYAENSDIEECNFIAEHLDEYLTKLVRADYRVAIIEG